jgi:hypothetical protein
MKFVLRGLVCVAAAAVLLATISSEADGQQKKKGVNGQVAKVDAESLTIKVKEKKKDGVVVTPAKDVSFKVNASTKVEKAGAKKDDPATPAAIADVQVGQNVIVVGTEGGVAEKITILQKKKKD